MDNIDFLNSILEKIDSNTLITSQIYRAIFPMD